MLIDTSTIGRIASDARNDMTSPPADQKASRGSRNKPRKMTTSMSPSAAFLSIRPIRWVSRMLKSL